MTEECVGFLYKLSSIISTNSGSKTLDYLRSYYLMRCHKLTKSYGLPTKQFSNNTRCSHCCLEWKPDNYITKIKSTKLSKKQRRKSKLKGERKSNSNIMERVCSLCKKTTNFNLNKPNANNQGQMYKNLQATKNYFLAKLREQPQIIRSPEQITNKSDTNVYTNTNSIFSLDNKSNKLSQQSPPKVIKNNKKKKDKFAGLCREAVLSAAKIASDKDKNKNLNLFLKPSV